MVCAQAEGSVRLLLRFTKWSRKSPSRRFELEKSRRQMFPWLPGPLLEEGAATALTEGRLRGRKAHHRGRCVGPAPPRGPASVRLLTPASGQFTCGPTSWGPETR